MVSGSTSAAAGATALDDADRLAIRELADLYGHVLDAGAWDRLPELFTEDVVYDLTFYGWGTVAGIDALRALWTTVEHPLAHHVTNVVIKCDADGTVRVASKGIGLRADGTAHSTEYRDVVRRTPRGWRIACRTAWRRTAESTPGPPGTVTVGDGR